MASYDKALQIDEWYKHANNGKATVFLALGKPEEALRSLDRALLTDPGYKEALFNKGTAFEQLGQHDQARKFYQQSLSIDKKLQRSPHRTWVCFLE